MLNTYFKSELKKKRTLHRNYNYVQYYVRESEKKNRNKLRTHQGMTCIVHCLTSIVVDILDESRKIIIGQFIPRPIPISLLIRMKKSKLSITVV